MADKMDSDDDDNNYSGDEYAYDDGSEPDGYHDDDGMEEEHIVEMKTGEVRRQLSKEGSERAVVLSGFGKVVGCSFVDVIVLYNHLLTSTSFYFKVPDGKFIITEYQEIVSLMDNVIKEVSTLLEIDSDAAQILLQCFRWDKERLVDAFFSNPEKVMSDAGLDKYNADLFQSLRQQQSQTDAAVVTSSSATFSCRICCDELDQNASLCLGIHYPTITYPWKCTILIFPCSSTSTT